MHLIWSVAAQSQLKKLTARAPGQAAAVTRAIEWMAAIDMAELGRLTRGRRRRYWPVPPHGIYYECRDGKLIVHAIREARRRRNPFRLADVATETGYIAAPAR